MKNVTLPITDLKKFLRATVAHLPDEFEIIGVNLVPGSRSVRFEIEPREPRAKATKSTVPVKFLQQ
jgi:hypothetical protein